jgi:hypothetical protein
MLEESNGMQADIPSVPDEQWAPRRDMSSRTSSIGSGVRAKLRKSFDKGTDVLFDSDEGLIDPQDYSRTPRPSKASEIGYLARRSKRLTEIRENL